MALQQSKIFRLWQAVEALTPQDAVKIAADDQVSPAYRADPPDSLMPWNVGHAHSRKRPLPGRAWRYTVQCGVYDTTPFIESLTGKLGLHPDVHEDRGTKTCRLFDIVADKNGVPSAESFALSMAAWACGVVLRGGVQAMANGGCGLNLDDLPLRPAHVPPSDSGYSEFDNLQDRLREEIAKRAAQFVDAQGNVIAASTKAWYDEIATLIIDKCGLPAGIVPVPTVHYVKCFQVSEKPGKTDAAKSDDDLLNSFFIRDLNRLAVAPTIGRGLTDYLVAKPRTDRIDVCTAGGLQTAEKIVRPAYHPVGRWPSEYPLAFSQQVAINALWAELADKPGIFAVNGPPGTGKTTLLRDVVAAVVVTRAACLAKLAHPTQAFGPKMVKKIGDSNIPYHDLAEGIGGYAIIVASCNNGAVENISLELPAMKAVENREEQAFAADYFPDIATSVIGQKAWGLIAARLGNKQNRNDFLTRFWFGIKATDKRPACPGLMEHMKALLEGKVAPKLAWADAVKAFHGAVERERGLRAQLVAAAGLPAELQKETENGNRIAVEIGDINTKLNGLAPSLIALDADEKIATGVERETTILRTEHQQNRPGILDWLATFGGSHRRWWGKMGSLEDALAAAREKRKDLAARRAHAQRLNAELQRLASQKATEAAASAKQVTKLSAELGKAMQILGSKWPDIEACDRDRELSAPWATDSWMAARTDVFVAALALHRALIEGAPVEFNRNLNLAVDWLSGRRLERSMARIALDSLTLVVPALSTTFASVGRMFGDIEAEKIGWLLIDEAGQAMPQQAAGAIWRARRTVVVGDPLQLEPVATLPPTLEAALAKALGVGQAWWPSETSAQELADMVTRVGTNLPSARKQGEKIWVGAPLRVHRRCLNPMFEISNRVAYDGLMIHGVKSGDDCELPKSGWIDVCGSISEGHWIREEGEALHHWITYLTTVADADPSEIFLISPFRDVARKLWTLASRYGLDRTRRVGTVHTTQGKEADIVILVLGGHPDKHGAKDWAAKKPNLLNVAASRAKRRLYVIGDMSEWKKRRYFDIMAGKLPVIPALGAESDRQA